MDAAVSKWNTTRPWVFGWDWMLICVFKEKRMIEREREEQKERERERAIATLNR